MNADANLGRLARAVGDPTRIAMLALLMEGRAVTAKELAYGAGVEPATATTHLRRLEEAGVVRHTAQGRYRYFRLASPEMAHLVETMMVLARAPLTDEVGSVGASGPSRGQAPRRAAMPRIPEPMRHARYCYDHLAGRLGTGLTEAMLARDWLRREEDTFALTGAGERALRDLGLELDALRRGRRRLAFPCLDWSERRHHLAGALGAALAQRLTALGWIERRPGSRAVTIARKGARGLERRFGFELSAAPEGR